MQKRIQAEPTRNIKVNSFLKIVPSAESTTGVCMVTGLGLTVPSIALNVLAIKLNIQCIHLKSWTKSCLMLAMPTGCVSFPSFLWCTSLHIVFYIYLFISFKEWSLDVIARHNDYSENVQDKMCSGVRRRKVCECGSATRKVWGKEGVREAAVSLKLEKCERLRSRLIPWPGRRHSLKKLPWEQLGVTGGREGLYNYNVCMGVCACVCVFWSDFYDKLCVCICH